MQKNKYKNMLATNMNFKGSNLIILKKSQQRTIKTHGIDDNKPVQFKL